VFFSTRTDIQTLTKKFDGKRLPYVVSLNLKPSPTFLSRDPIRPENTIYSAYI
jgi:hypothetical protein